MKHIAALLLVAALPTRAADAPITFPADGGVLDVRAYGAKPDDNGDDTAAIQKALDAHPNGNRIIYLTSGKWLVSDTLNWPAGTSGGVAHKRTTPQTLAELWAGFDPREDPLEIELLKEWVQ